MNPTETPTPAGSPSARWRGRRAGSARSQLRGRGQHPGPVLGAGRHARRGGAGLGARAARAGPGDDPVLGHVRRRGRGDVGDLTALHPRHRRPGQVRAAAPAAVRRRRRRSRSGCRPAASSSRRLTGLLAGLAARRGARRAPLRLAVGRVRGRRLRARSTSPCPAAAPTPRSAPPARPVRRQAATCPVSVSICTAWVLITSRSAAFAFRSGFAPASAITPHQTTTPARTPRHDHRTGEAIKPTRPTTPTSQDLIKPEGPE